MNRLNNDSMGHVLQFLPLRDRCHATTVCRLWAAVSRQTPVCLPVEMRFHFESTQQSDRKPRIAALPAATQSDGHSTTPYSGNVFGFAFSEAHFDTQSTDGGSDYQCFDHPVWELDFSAMNGSKIVFKKAHDELGAVAMQRFVSEIASYVTFLPGHPRRQWQLKFPDCTGPAMMVDMLAAIHECLPKDDDWQKVISRVRSIKVTLQSLRPVVIDVKSVDELSVELERAFAAIKTQFADTVLAAPQWRRLSTSYGSKLDLSTVAIDLVLAGCAAQEEHIAVINESVRRHGWVYVSRIAVAPDQASLVVLETDPIQFFEQCTVREAFTIEMPSTYSSMTKHVASTLCTLPWTTFDPRQKCEDGFLYKEMSPEGFDMRLALQINRLPLRHLFTRQDASMSLDRELPDTMSDEEFEQQTDILVSMMAAMNRSGWRAAGIWTHGTTKVAPSNEDMVLGRRSRFADLLADADLLPPQFYPEFVEAVATLQMSDYGKECRSAVAAARRALSSRFSALPGFSFGLKIGNYNIRFNGSAARPGQPFVEVAGDIFHLDSDSSEVRDIYWKNVFFILNKLADVVPGMNDVPDAGRRLICTVATSPREASKFAHQYEQDGTVATEWHVESRLKLRDILRNLDADSSAHASWKTCWPQAVLQMVDSTFLQSTVSSMWMLAAANQTQKSSTTKIVAWEVDRFVLYAN